MRQGKNYCAGDYENRDDEILIHRPKSSMFPFLQQDYLPRLTHALLRHYSRRLAV